MLQTVLEALEPANVYEQAVLARSQRTFRMRLADAFYRIFRKWL